MKPIYFIILMAIVGLSCSHQQSPTQKRDSVVVKQQLQVTYHSSKEDTTPIIIDTTKKLIGYSTEHIFSDTTQKDIFSITLYGQDVVKGMIIFKILDFQQRQIFREQFPAKDLLGDQEDMLNIKQQKDTINMEMSRFLNEKHFAKPAIDASQKLELSFEEPDDTDKRNWREIKADQSAIGFLYSHGYEGTYGISYSKKQKKVVSIFESD